MPTPTGLRARALVGGRDGRQGAAEPAALVEVLVVDRGGRPERQAALGVAVVAPPHQGRALPEPVLGTEVADVAVDHRQRLDRRARAGAADHGTAVAGGLHGRLGGGVGQDLHRQPLVAAEHVDAVGGRVGERLRVGRVHRVGAVEQHGQRGGAAGVRARSRPRRRPPRPGRSAPGRARGSRPGRPGRRRTPPGRRRGRRSVRWRPRRRRARSPPAWGSRSHPRSAPSPGRPRRQQRRPPSRRRPAPPRSRRR